MIGLGLKLSLGCAFIEFNNHLPACEFFVYERRDDETILRKYYDTRQTRDTARHDEDCYVADASTQYSSSSFDILKKETHAARRTMQSSSRQMVSPNLPNATSVHQSDGQR